MSVKKLVVLKRGGKIQNLCVLLIFYQFIFELALHFYGEMIIELFRSARKVDNILDFQEIHDNGDHIKIEFLNIGCHQHFQ